MKPLFYSLFAMLSISLAIFIMYINPLTVFVFAICLFISAMILTYPICWLYKKITGEEL